jgi:ubiquitin fusion degradation protein 1
VVTNNDYDGDVKVPAALNLPHGQLFFGFNVTAYTPPASSVQQPIPLQEQHLFSGSGNTLNGRSAGTGSSKGKEKAAPQQSSSLASWGTAGQTLGRRSGPTEVGAGGASVPRPPRRNTKQQEKERSPTPDFGVDDDDVIMIDSD